MTLRSLYEADAPEGPSIFGVPMQCARIILSSDSSIVGSLIKPGFRDNPCKINCVIERLDGKTISVRCPTCGDYVAPIRIKFAFVNCGDSHLISGVTRNYYEINKTQFKITGQMISDSNSIEFQTKILSQVPKTAWAAHPCVHKDKDLAGEMKKQILQEF